MSGDVLDLHSSSAATDGGFIAIAEVATALEATGSGRLARPRLFTSRPRANKKIGDVVTTEVPGLATALHCPPVAIPARFHLTNGHSLEAPVHIPDAASRRARPGRAGARRHHGRPDPEAALTARRRAADDNDEEEGRRETRHSPAE